MDYITIDIRVTADQEENHYLVTASTTGRKKDAVSGRFHFLASSWENVESSLVALGVRGPATNDHMQQIRGFGKFLFDCLTSGEVRSLYDEKKQDAVKNAKILRLRLTLVPLELVILPWEMLFDGRVSEYLCLTHHPQTVLIRSIDNVTQRRGNTPNYELPLRILGMVADPPDILIQLQAESEKRIIEGALQPLMKDKKVYLEWKQGRVSELDDLKYTDDRWDIFHFIGHGRFEETNQGEQGQLAFENEKDRNRSKYISAWYFNDRLPSSTRLVVLNACETGRGSRFDRLSNIAHSLATQKIPAVVAMQFKIQSSAATKFSEIFYMLLAKGIAVDEAIAEARREVHTTADDPNNTMDWAAPILYISSPKVFSFETDSKPKIKRSFPPKGRIEEKSLVSAEGGVYVPMTPVSNGLAPEVTHSQYTENTAVLASLERANHTHVTTTVVDELPGIQAGLQQNTTSVMGEQKETVAGQRFSLPPFIRRNPRRFSIILTGVLILILIAGSLGVLVSKLLVPPQALFPALCSGNFQSATANTSIVPTPPPGTSPDGEPIGLSEGATAFDLLRPDSSVKGVQDKLQAAQSVTNNPQNVVPSLNDAIRSDPTDAEARIYLENWNVLKSGHPHITFIVGVSFLTSYTEASRDVLQGAFVAQKECNEQNRQNSNKTQIVLMVANVGGNSNGDILNASTQFVADQIVEQARKDTTIIGIMGWPLSAATIDVQNELKEKGSNLPMLAACSTSDYLTGTSHFFRICPTDMQQAKIAAHFVLDVKQKKRIAILYQAGSSWGYSLQSDFFDDVTKARGNIVGRESYTIGDQKSIQVALTKLLAQNPDTLFFAGYPGDLTRLLHVFPQDHTILIMGGSSFTITNAYPNPLPNLHNVYFTGYASPNLWDGMAVQPPFFQQYKDLFGSLTAPTGLPSIDAGVLLAYDGMVGLLNGSQRALSMHNNVLTASYLEDGLKQITAADPIQGVTGRIAFDSNGDQDSSKIVLVEHIEGYQLVIDEKHGCLQRSDCSQ